MPKKLGRESERGRDGRHDVSRVLFELVRGLVSLFRGGEVVGNWPPSSRDGVDWVAPIFEGQNYTRGSKSLVYNHCSRVGKE